MPHEGNRALSRRPAGRGEDLHTVGPNGYAFAHGITQLATGKRYLEISLLATADFHGKAQFLDTRPGRFECFLDLGRLVANGDCTADVDFLVRSDDRVMHFDNDIGPITDTECRRSLEFGEQLLLRDNFDARLSGQRVCIDCV